MKYSVIIPVGKRPEILNKCLNSLLKQIIKPDKIILVLNNSVNVNDIPLIISNNPSVIVASCVGSNANIARNFGADLVETDWLAFLDSDDEWDDNTSSLFQHAIAKEPFADIIYGSYSYTFTKQKAIEVQSDVIENYTTVENYIIAGKSCATGSFIMKRKIFLNGLRWNECIRRHQDFDYFSRLYNSGKKMVPISDIVLHVDWSAPTKHKFHCDYIKVTKQWRTKVDCQNFARYHLNILRSAIRSKDWRGGFIIAPHLIKDIVIISFKICKNYLNRKKLNLITSGKRQK